MNYMPLDLNIAIFCVFLQAGLTFYAVLRVGHARINAIRAENIKLAQIALDGFAYPDEARKQANNLTNQFEFPVLLYMSVAFAAIFDASSMPFAIACAGFVASRIVHRFIHVRSNNVVLRFKVFLVGVVFLAAAWVLLAINMTLLL
jgi:hypothetical protein